VTPLVEPLITADILMPVEAPRELFCMLTAPPAVISHWTSLGAHVPSGQETESEAGIHGIAVDILYDHGNVICNI